MKVSVILLLLGTIIIVCPAISAPIPIASWSENAEDVTYKSFDVDVYSNATSNIWCGVVYSLNSDLSVNITVSETCYADPPTNNHRRIEVDPVPEAYYGRTIYYASHANAGYWVNTSDLHTVNLTPGYTTVNSLTGVNFTYTFFSAAGNQTFYLVDETVAGCAASTSAILDEDGTVIACYNTTLVEDRSYSVDTIGHTPTGTVKETNSVWFKRTTNPIAALSSEFALFIALFIMMFTAMMAGPSTAPAVSLCVTFEGWVFYSMNMLAAIDNLSGLGMYFVPMVLTVMTLTVIFWNFVEFRRKNK